LGEKEDRLAAEAGLLRRARQGDRQAADDLLEPNRKWLTDYFRRRLRDAYEAEAFAQDVITAAFAQLDGFRGGCPVSAWLLAIANNAFRKYLERDPYKKGRLSSIYTESTLDALAAWDGPTGEAERTHERLFAEQLLEVAREVCSTDERAVLLRVYQGDSLEEVADLLGKPAATVRSLLRRGREKFLAHLVENRPDMLGGKARLDAAWEMAMAAPDPGERPTPAEVEAWQEGKVRHGNREAFRSACLKVARHLPLHAAWICALLQTTDWRGLP
jgi:RNA polymerase sigma-70 factor, ECF subfamily